MKKLWNILFSTRLMSLLIIVYFVAMAIATFVENDYGTQSAKALIYNAWWFELIMLMLTLNFVGNIFRYRLYRREKWPVLVFHLAFIITLFGAFITRYFGFEGLMPIREGSVSDTILSDITYVQVKIDDAKEYKELEKEVLFGALSDNSFTLKENFKGIPVQIKYGNYIPHAKSEFTADSLGVDHLHLVYSNENGRQDIYIPNEQTIQIADQIFSFNQPIAGGMNFLSSQQGLFFVPNAEGTFMQMQTRELTPVYQDSLVPAAFLKLYAFPSVQFVIPEMPVKGRKDIVSASKEEQSKYEYDVLALDILAGNEAQQILVKGAKNAISDPVKVQLGGLNVTVHYGSKELKTPFAIKLRDFQLDRYPGTNSPSSFASEITVIEPNNSFDYRIFMNHVLDYKGYRFFQASYHPDEKGTVLSVNHDYWGTMITYLGYILMGLGMFFTLFWKGTRFADVSTKLRKLSTKKITTLLLIFLLSGTLFAQTNSEEHPPANLENVRSKTPEKYVVAKEHADKFGTLLIQDFQGRMKPVNSYALEVLRKVYKKDKYQGLTAEQVILSAQIDPYAWGEEYLIHVKPNASGQKVTTDLNVQKGLTSAANFYKTGSYYLTDIVNEASIKKNMDRTATDKEMINLDDRFNVWVSVLNGTLLHIYPKPEDPNNKWFAGIDTNAFVAQDTMILKMHSVYMNSLVKAVQTGDYTDADFYVDLIKGYQLKQGAAVIPSAKKIDLEIKYNHWNIFKKLMFSFMLLGFVILFFAFVTLFSNKEVKWIRYLLKFLTILTVIGVIVQAIGLALRWYISGHAPWSNGYEAVVFVSFVTVIAGLIFSYKKSSFILAVTVIFASFLLGIAHGNLMNPEISNLVPVLKSYWLMIHVAVITSSYAFLGLGSLLGVVVLLMFIFRKSSNAQKINNLIDELTYVNELTLTVGLFTLSIGTFLGGVWASESWGRYWSWDPKEVWSLISMMVYIFVLHMRLVPGLRGKFTLNLVSMWSISTLIMTFFGVNFYLSGMHSYAAGDPVPIPVWIYYALAFFVVFSIVSYWRYRTFKK